MNSDTTYAISVKILRHLRCIVLPLIGVFMPFLVYVAVYVMLTEVWDVFFFHIALLALFTVIPLLSFTYAVSVRKCRMMKYIYCLYNGIAMGISSALVLGKQIDAVLFFGIISLIVISYLVVKKYKKVSNE